MKVDYDFTLSGDNLYYKNLERWYKAHEDATSLVYDNETRQCAFARYECPTREDFEAMKQVNNLLIEIENR